ncbi:hypothetical protein L1987_77468 [Smallanthus sonchifolius]|uniref:Uncharacterized protein n=1 Tax=Smallanthus sonchifolius TaxID=185202 RepID=A0ACB8Z9N9_9ASTR|nr:hypothetical protein L1987_77468 [Smallanthus sonchifolius]
MASLHPAVTVTNIKNFIPIVLEMENGQYTSWVELFKIHCHAFEVIDHILPPTPAPITSSKDKAKEEDVAAAEKLWPRLDAIVLQWIYGTISNDLLHTVLKPGATAAQAWQALESIFIDNRSSQALYLENRFSNIKLDSFPNVSAYCQELKTISDQLSNVEAPITNQRLVLQLIAGLNDQFEGIAMLLQQTTPLPDFYNTRSKLVLEETRKNNQSQPIPATALHTTTVTGPAPRPLTASPDFRGPTYSNPPQRYGGRGYHYHSYRGRGRSGRGRGRERSRGRANYNSGYPSSQRGQSPPSLGQHFSYTNSPWHTSPWTGPPAPYPTIPAPVHRTRPGSAGAGLLGAPPSHAYAASNHSFTPTNIEQALHTMTLNPNQNWYLDTGATNHMSNTTGYPFYHRGYKCYELSTRKLIISLHVIFDEYIFPFATQHPTPPSYDFLHTNLSPTLHPFIWDNVQPTTFPPQSAPTGPTQPPPAPSPSPSPTHSAQTTPPPQPRPEPSTANQTTPLFQTYSRRQKQPNQPPGTVSPQQPSSPQSPAATPPPTPPPPLRTMTTRSMAKNAQTSPTLNLHTARIEPLPRSPALALAIPVWNRAMTDEFHALIENNTWELVPRTPDMNIIRCMWIFKHKNKSDGSLERYKARLVCDGRSQQIGVDCDETFSQVVKPATICTVLSITLFNNWEINQLDVKNAFLHGFLSETVFMHQPVGFRDPTMPHHVCRLKKSLYGLKQAPRAWYQRFTDYVTTLGFHHSSCDHSLFIYRKGYDIAYLLLYVDDIILTTSSPDLKTRLLHHLSTEFAMKDLGPLSYFLGISVSRNNNGMFLSQSKYAQEILHRAHMHSCNPVHTPVDTAGKLSATSGTPLDPTTTATLFRSLAGALQYLTFTRPDIAYAVQQVCMHMHLHTPHDAHMHALKRILRYIKGTLTMGLHMSPSLPVTLTAYTDADWAGCPDTRRSTSGYCVFLGDNLLSWSSKRQTTISRSSAEAEYRGVANVVAEICWLRNLLLELGRPPTRTSLVYCDNVSAIYMSGNPVQHQRTKHIEIDIHFVREKVQHGQTRVLHVPSRHQLADIFTKGLPRVLFNDFRSSLSIRHPPP